MTGRQLLTGKLKARPPPLLITMEEDTRLLVLQGKGRFHLKVKCLLLYHSKHLLGFHH
jgi:hypothetical protein